MGEKLPVIELFGPTIQGEGLLVGRPTHFLRLGGCSFRCTWCDSMHAVDPQQVKANRTMMTWQEIVEALKRLSPAPWLTLTGGDPCMHKGETIENLIDAVFASEQMSIAVETQGVFFPEWLGNVDAVTFSPKGPSSEQGQSIIEFRDNLVKFRQNGARGLICIKPVVFSADDLKWALQLYRTVTETPSGRLYNHFTFQVGSPLTSEAPDFRESVEHICGHEKNPEDTREAVHTRLVVGWKRDQILQRYQWLVGALLNSNVSLGPTVSITPQVHTLLWPTEEKGR